MELIVGSLEAVTIGPVAEVTEVPGLELTGSPGLELTINTFGLAVLVEIEPLMQLALGSLLIWALSPVLGQETRPVAIVESCLGPATGVDLHPVLPTVGPEADLEFSLVTDEDLDPAGVAKVWVCLLVQRGSVWV